MSLKLKIWLILGVVMLALTALGALLEYREIERDAWEHMRQQARDLRASLMATRRVYHQQFLASGLPLNDRTLGFLPAHAMSRIAQDYPNWTHSGVRFNNVSDHPRNPANQADADELAVIAWFRAHPRAQEYLGRIRDRQGREFFHFATPIWTEPYCLACHANVERAPPVIRQHYKTGDGYRPGDLRGVMSIRIPAETGRAAALDHWLRELGRQVLFMLVLIVTLGLLLHRFVTRRLLRLCDATREMARGEYQSRVAEGGEDEIGELARGFNAMATEIEQREQALEDREQQYRILADHSWSWDYWLGADGRYRYISPACARITGHPPEAFLADPDLMERLLHPDDLSTWRAHLEVALRAPHPHAQMTLRIRTPAGDYRWIEHTCVPVFDNDGQFLGRRGVNLDITERRRTEELERFSAFQAGIAEMSTSVLHNIGNAITAVTQDAEIIDNTGGELGRVATLLDDNASRAEATLAESEATAGDLARRQCAIQHEAARAIRGLANDVLRQRSRRLGDSVRHIADIVRIQQSAARSNGQHSSFSLSQAIQSALDMQGDAFTRRRIEVAMTVEPSVDMVTLSHNRLLQALINVFRNSIEAIDQRALSETFQGRVETRAEALGADRLRITVTDNGIGFDPATRDKLFRFGYSSKQRGTGFGLHSMAVFAQECGGRVTLESDGPGRGARLLLELPRIRAAEMAAGVPLNASREVNP